MVQKKVKAEKEKSYEGKNPQRKIESVDNSDETYSGKTEVKQRVARSLKKNLLVTGILNLSKRKSGIKI